MNVVDDDSSVRDDAFSKNNDATTTATTTTTHCARNNRDCFFDIELASLSRLENVVGALVRRLLHERDAFERRCVSLRLTVSSRYESSSFRRQSETTARFDVSNATEHRRNTVPPLIISRVRIDSRVSKVKACDIFERVVLSSRRTDVSINAIAPTVSKNSEKIDEFIAHVCDRNDVRSMERASYAIDNFRKVVDAATTTTVSAFSDNEKDSSTTTRRCDATDRARWFIDKFDALVRATAELTATASTASLKTKRQTTDYDDDNVDRVDGGGCGGGDDASRQRLSLLNHFFLIPFFDFSDNVVANDVTDSSSERIDWILLHSCLFFQWFRLMSIFPLEYDYAIMPFVWLAGSSVVRVFACRHAFERYVLHRRVTATETDSTSGLNVERAKSTFLAALQNESTFSKTSTVDSARRVRAVTDDNVFENVDSENGGARSSSSRSFDEKAALLEFVVTDGGKFAVSSESRSRHGTVDVVVKDGPADSSANVSATTRRTKDSSSATFVKKKRSFPENSQLTVTAEQERVLRDIEEILGKPLLETTTRIVKRRCRGYSNKPESDDCPKDRNDDDNDDDVTTRRVLVDGVAGAGKTFILGVLLRRFERVRYLVKKRSFVDATVKRFAEYDNLRAQTIDSYLMNRTNVRNLPTWLRERRDNLDGLKRRLREERQLFVSTSRDDDEELIFVDEYSLVERSLAVLLNVALRNRRVVLVGDCNQQPAIGDAIDQPVRTLLGYENVCFMYENVRTNDCRLLRRLNRFNVKTEDTRFNAVKDLPDEREIDLSDFLRDFSKKCETRRASVAMKSQLPARNDRFTNCSSLLPRVIVSSNAQVNYLNWAIGYTVWLRERANGRCLRYRREIVVGRETFDRLRVVDFAEFTTKSEHEATVADDAFADELFVTTGMRYRMIHGDVRWPVQIGSRVVVKRILSKNQVRVVTDDDRAIEFDVRKCRVKPYEYQSRWNLSDLSTRGNDYVAIFMFPFVMDAATTVYQVQGLTLTTKDYERCYVDVRGMDEKSLYVTLSRFENESQIRGVLNRHTLL